MKVGDYVKTYDGAISKIKNHNYYWVNKLEYNYITTDKNENYDVNLILKSSPNIIDLIEVGDYVDKLRVVDKYENYIVVETFDERIFITKEDTIKSIVTKEAFESMEYRIGE